MKIIIIITIIIIVTGRPWEYRLNWIPDPAPATPRDHGIKKSPPSAKEENHPPASHPSRIPRKIGPRRRKQTHQRQHLPGTNENSPGIDLRHRWMKRTPQKHPQHPQHPLPVTTNENSPGANSWNQADPGRLYKQAQGSKSTSTHDGTLPLLPSSFTCLNTFSSTAFFPFLVPTVT